MYRLRLDGFLKNTSQFIVHVAETRSRHSQLLLDSERYLSVLRPRHSVIVFLNHTTSKPAPAEYLSTGEEQVQNEGCSSNVGSVYDTLHTAKQAQ